MPYHCRAFGCANAVAFDSDFCGHCQDQINQSWATTTDKAPSELTKKYPKYYKSTEGMNEIDVYAVHKLFNIQDPSGAIQHASKKLLLSGARTGNKSAYKDIEEARDTLTRWLQLHQEENQ